jgi:hypothetical protein
MGIENWPAHHVRFKIPDCSLIQERIKYADQTAKWAGPECVVGIYKAAFRKADLLLKIIYPSINLSVYDFSSYRHNYP